jgi:cytochrome c-type biogenesis protein CcmH
VPLVAVFIYVSIGEPDALDPVKVAGDPGHQVSAEQMAGLVEQLAARLEQDPGDPTGWLMLVRSYAMLGDLEGASRTWARIGDKVPDDAGILADWADVLVGAQQGDFSGEPDRLIARSLALEPDNVKALALGGTAAYQRGDYAAAAHHWENILAQVPPGDEAYGSIVASINEARQRGGMPPLGASSMPTTNPADAQRANVQGREAFDGDAPPGQYAGAVQQPGEGVGVTGARPADGQQDNAALRVSGTVRLSPDLAATAQPDDVVFVFVRPADGGIPVAALRVLAGELPREFGFEGVPLMTEGPLPSQLLVAARLSRHGDATARSGDLEGVSAAVSPHERDVEVVIDRVRE